MIILLYLEQHFLSPRNSITTTRQMVILLLFTTILDIADCTVKKKHLQTLRDLEDLERQHKHFSDVSIMHYLITVPEVSACIY